jgi:CDP-glucose 4,6-dehydratase
MNPQFWRERRVLVTGHTGFKGSWMSLWLQAMGAEVTGFALAPNTTPSLFEEARVASGMQSVIGDIRDPAALAETMQQARPEVVIHMAAQPLVRYSYQAPVETYATNVMGTVHVLEAVRRTREVRAVVNVTTDKCYENREWVWGYREDEPMGGHDPYSSSKGCAELVSASYRRSFLQEAGVALATARAGNVIGGGDWAPDRLIPDILRGFEEGAVVPIRRPTAVRPWQHVLEPVRGYLMLADALHTRGAAYAEAWNFGPNDEDARPVSWIVERMASLWGQDARWELDPGQHPHEAGYLKLDISKVRARLGWHPALRLADALQMIVEWSRERRAGTDVRRLTLDQIDAYQQSLAN